MKRPLRKIAAAALGALLFGVFINAVALQHGRRLAPLWGTEAVGHLSRTAPAPPPRPSGLRTQERRVPAPVRAVERRPTVAARAVDAAKPTPRPDAIGQLIANDAPSASERPDVIAAVQRALRKLGYNVRRSGKLDIATRQALERFERARKLTLSSRLAPRTVRELAIRSGVFIPRE